MKLLKQLNDYCKTLPDDYDQFDMECYMHGVGSPKKDFIPTCGTVACFAGHGIAAGIEPLENEEWKGYSERLLQGASVDTWEYLFGWPWVGYDNTLKGAIARADKVLAGFKPTHKDLPWRIN